EHSQSDALHAAKVLQVHHASQTGAAMRQLRKEAELTHDQILQIIYRFCSVRAAAIEHPQFLEVIAKLGQRHVRSILVIRCAGNAAADQSSAGAGPFVESDIEVLDEL